MKHHKLPVRITGQHFTVDAALIKYTIELAELRHCDLVYDLGGGKGYITDQLLKSTDNVIVIENDKALLNYLRRKFSPVKGVKIIETDILDYTFPNSAFKVVSNIPYSITSHIFKKLMYNNLRNFQGGCIVTQLEPAMKIVSDCNYNPYSIFYKTFYDISLVREISPSSFNPPPTVKSALLCIKRRKETVIPIESSAAYLRFLFFLLRKPDLAAFTALKTIFRKKQIRFLMEKHHMKLDKAITCMTVEEWINCFVEMRRIVPSSHQP